MSCVGGKTFDLPQCNYRLRCLFRQIILTANYDAWVILNV